jgi:hypothetical protein
MIRTWEFGVIIIVIHNCTQIPGFARRTEDIGAGIPATAVIVKDPSIRGRDPIEGYAIGIYGVAGIGPFLHSALVGRLRRAGIHALNAGETGITVANGRDIPPAQNSIRV